MVSVPELGRYPNLTSPTSILAHDVLHDLLSTLLTQYVHDTIYEVISVLHIVAVLV